MSMVFGLGRVDVDFETMGDMGMGSESRGYDYRRPRYIKHRGIWHKDAGQPGVFTYRITKSGQFKPYYHTACGKQFFAEKEVTTWLPISEPRCGCCQGLGA